MNHPIERKRTPRFLTNLLAEHEQFVHQAAETTGFDMVVRHAVLDQHGNPMSNCISVWTNEPTPRNHGPFWQEYRRLVDAAETD